MRCTSYSTSVSYDFSRLVPILQKNGSIESFRNALYVHKPNQDIFYFSYGVLIFWGFSEEEEKKHLAFLKEFEQEPLLEYEFDEMNFDYEGEKIQIRDDHISLPDHSGKTKWAISYGLAQSVQLATFERMIQKTIDQCQKIPQELAKKGKISLSRKETSLRMGEIFIERNFINLHSEIFDTPEFFWEHPELEKFYIEIIRYLDINKRIELLNKRLDILHEFFEILSNQINHQHSSRLELIIILLILIEVVFLLLRDLFHLL